MTEIVNEKSIYINILIGIDHFEIPDLVIIVCSIFQFCLQYHCESLCRLFMQNMRFRESWNLSWTKSDNLFCIRQAIS